MSKINVEQLIENIKENEILWNLNHPFYKHIKKKAKAWRAVALECDTSVHAIKKKWKGLRDSFSRDIYRSLNNMHEGEEMQYKWRYTYHMQFLREHLRLRQFAKNYESDSETHVWQSFNTKASPADPMTIDTFYNEYPASPVTADCKSNNEHVDIKNNRNDVDDDVGAKNYENVTDDDGNDDDNNNDDDDVSAVIGNIDNDVDAISDETEEQLITTTLSTTKDNDDQSSILFVDSNNYNNETTKRAKLELETNLLNTMASLKKVLMKSQEKTVITIPTSLNCEDELYCRSMMEKISKFPLRKKNEAKLKFMEYLCKMEAEIEKEKNK